MTKHFTYILIFTIFFGCSKNDTEWSSEKNATIYFGSEPKNEKFTLTFNKTDKSLNYKYVNQIDTTKTITIRKIRNSDSLFFGSGKFIKNDKIPFSNDELQGLEFEYYETVDYSEDATGPILFNPKYGLLAINNVYGPTIILLDEKNDSLTEKIIKKLNE
ncbi:hypothetical protein G3567_12875 [Psychroflexus sp. YR1-1]|uniref:Lipoprotein n=1 Tax=Psychroflexus aurantiacus TaxID=2709310 RepID=A0A6B3R669_9FLAO|nr:hypothetical protein [Psychroflexus aurantiacus]NEV95030.1 hypothetical protein [Psychroflexus aurantiacus]